MVERHVYLCAMHARIAKQLEGPRLLLLGDEALAQGALDAGISGAYAYPGTPSTEILEFIQQAPETTRRGIHCRWSANEKTAFEAALGMSFAGKRALVSMKHVGLNVAADPFMNSAITGANGGLVLIVADDPSMHSSQNEQDSRIMAQFAQVPVFEPPDQQTGYLMMADAFDLSEELGLPVMVRITTRLAHSRADIQRYASPRSPNELHVPADPRQFVLLPAIARRNYAALIEKQVALRSRAEHSPYNIYSDGPDGSMGILACGVTRNYLFEHFPERNCPYPTLCVGQYPVPTGLVRRLTERCASLLVLEEGYPLVEGALEGLLGFSKPLLGRLHGPLPRTGELDPDFIAPLLKLGVWAGPPPDPLILRHRPPQLCRGCPHTDTYEVLNAALAEKPDARVFADIGCYTLGALPPFNAIHSCVDMGASLTMAKGAADAGIRPAIAVVGDSTFTHSGLTGLLDAVYENTPVTVLILDNETIAMTGLQESMARGRIEALVTGIGVDPAHLRVLTPLKKNKENNVAVLKEEFAHEGVSIVIMRRPCVHLRRRN